MTKQELEQIIGFEISFSEFESANNQYMNCDLDKYEFCKLYKSYYLSLHPGKNEQIKEQKRRDKMTNRQKAIEDIELICSSVDSELPINDFNYEKNDVLKSDMFDFYFLLRYSGSEVYKNKYDAFYGHRNVNEWGHSRVALYHLIGKELGVYTIEIVKQY